IIITNNWGDRKRTTKKHVGGVAIDYYPKLDASFVTNTPIGHVLHVNELKTLLMYTRIAMMIRWDVLPSAEVHSKFSI
ncbi:MAG: hypothetical protein WB612_01635, partial [Nitrososphaeraceae archaeon]